MKIHPRRGRANGPAAEALQNGQVEGAFPRRRATRWGRSASAHGERRRQRDAFSSSRTGTRPGPDGRTGAGGFRYVIPAAPPRPRRRDWNTIAPAELPRHLTPDISEEHVLTRSQDDLRETPAFPCRPNPSRPGDEPGRGGDQRSAAPRTPGRHATTANRASTFRPTDRPVDGRHLRATRSGVRDPMATHRQPTTTPALAGPGLSGVREGPASGRSWCFAAIRLGVASRGGGLAVQWADFDAGKRDAFGGFAILRPPSSTR